MIPKKKYRDKVRVRLEEVRNLFKDREFLEKMFVRLKVGNKTAVHNSIEHLSMLLDKDIPALLDALDQKTEIL